MNIIWFSEIRWDYLKTRKQHLLSRFPVTDKILFIQPTSFSNNNNSIPNGNIICKTIPVYKRGSKFIDIIFSLSIVRKLYYSITFIYFKILVYINLKSKIDIVCISNLYYIPFAKDISDKLVWDFNDDPEQFGLIPNWALILYNNVLSDRSTFIISCSVGLNKYIYRKFNNKPTTISNGVEISKFNKKNFTEKHKDKFILGYIGIISNWFFDFNLVELIAYKFPEIEIHIYGPEDKNAINKIKRLKNITNIIMFPTLDYENLPATINNFDIGIIPLKSEEKVWRAASAKLLQYLALEKPVVSVYMEQYLDLKNVFLCKTNDEFIKGISYLLKNEIRMEFNDLKKYDWQTLSNSYRQQLEHLISK